MSSLCVRCPLNPSLNSKSSKHAPKRPDMEFLMAMEEKQRGVRLFPVSVLAADYPLFFWMHRHWRAMTQFTNPTSGFHLFLALVLSIALKW